MCGIFGYIGSKNAVRISLDGLKRLEYRGYDSAGIAALKDGQIIAFKEVGKVENLEREVASAGLESNVAIAHTRWATHGKPLRENAHPQFDSEHMLALVHNGIIENFEQLKHTLEKDGIKFVSQTDTEVIAQLIGKFYKGNILKAVQQVVPLLEGAYAFALIHRDFPDQIIAVANEAPLVIGIGEDEAFISSDSNAFAFHTREVIYLSSAEIAVIKVDRQEVVTAANDQVAKQSQRLLGGIEEYSKGSYEHYTLKEIHEQPQAIRNAILNRFILDYGTASFDELNIDHLELHSVQRILFVACGTSWHAGYVGAYMMEEQARIPVQVEISSEFRYKNPIVPYGTLAVAISQSGETADTLAAMRELKAKGAKILAICNVHGSTIAREADHCIFLHAGPEVGVCSTKAFTSQVIVISLLALLLGRMGPMSKQQGREFLENLVKLPDQVQTVLDQYSKIKSIAEKYAKFENFFYIGRHYMYPTALEGALKLKEIAYINANGYPAGEMKHGPIALINENCPTLALCGNKGTYDKLLNNLMEIKARNGPIVAIAEESETRIKDIADDVIWVPNTIDELAPIPSTAAMQLFAYYVAKKRGADIDQPRNLAKSVTVE
jgi:glucosamine--fructose-6-phosphate aminotransferase (isomerizing)